MPTRPASHVTDDRAVAAVSHVVANAGYAAEVVHKDYGEDILVQTALDSKVDPFKVWIQVKGTECLSRFRSKGGQISLAVRKGHVQRWLQSNETVIVVLWDTVAGLGLWCKPSSQHTEWSLSSVKSLSVSLRFDESHKFTPAALQSIAWGSRILNYQLLVARAEALEYDLALNEEPEHTHVALVCYDFFKSIGILLPNGFEREFWEHYLSVLNGSSSESSRVDASILAILRHTNRVAGTGLPGMLLRQCVSFMQDIAVRTVDRTTGQLVCVA